MSLNLSGADDGASLPSSPAQDLASAGQAISGQFTAAPSMTAAPALPSASLQQPAAPTIPTMQVPSMNQSAPFIPGISDIAMKSEFEYDPIIPTNLGKHYYGYRHAQEGNIFVNPKDECKGVYLLNSAVPRMLIEKTEAMRFSIMDAVCAGEMIYLTDYLTRVANIEREIVDSITKGESTYLRQNTIKDPASYSKGPDESPYQHHQFWNEVFGEKYGMMPTPPYVTLKISLTTSNPTKMAAWLKGMADQSIAMKIGAWIKKKGRTEMTTIQLPTLYLKQTGIPPELIAVIDYDRMIGDLMTSFYLVLETLGYYGRGDKIKRLAYSEHVGF